MSFSRTYGDGRPPEEWTHHALAVERNLKRLGVDPVTACVLGRLHDLGKLTAQWQSYLCSNRFDRTFVEHRIHGAKELLKAVPHNTILARAINSHHGRDPLTGIQQSTKSDYSFIKSMWGFADGSGKVAAAKSPPLEGKEEELIKEALSLIPSLPQKFLQKPQDSFTAANDFRLTLARLVCSDWDAAGGVESQPSAGKVSLMQSLLNSIEKRYNAFGKPTTPVDRLRDEIRAALEEKAVTPPNTVYSLAVPTGGGKTLATMNWAVRHALKYGKRRIIVVVPFIRIIRQNAAVMRETFGDAFVLEAHSLAPLHKSERTEDHGWNGDVIVTTDVAFFRSWFTINTRNLLRSLDLVNSVIIFDEVQWIPSTHILPCTGFMKYLVENMNSTILLSTATMPDYSHFDEMGAVSMVTPTPLLPESVTSEWYERMRRIECRYIGELTVSETVAHFNKTHPGVSALFIVNSTAHAKQLYSALYEDCDNESVFHLSRRMTQGDIERVLEKVQRRLSSGKQTVLVSTPLIEAGVDISFPVVYRSQCGLDSLAQSAGRCNRHGEMEKLGIVYLYKRDAIEGEQEYKNPFWNTLNRGFRSLSETFKDEMENDEALDIYDSTRMQMCFRKFIVRNGERDTQGLLKGFEGCGKDINLLGEHDETRVLVVQPDLEIEVTAMLERESKDGKKFKFTDREQEIIALNTVPMRFGKRLLSKLKKTLPGMESSDILVFYISDVNTPFTYNSTTGLEFSKTFFKD